MSFVEIDPWIQILLKKPFFEHLKFCIAKIAVL
jgi:hypothetical protein